MIRPLLFCFLLCFSALVSASRLSLANSDSQLLLLQSEQQVLKKELGQLESKGLAAEAIEANAELNQLRLEQLKQRLRDLQVASGRINIEHRELKRLVDDPTYHLTPSEQTKFALTIKLLEKSARLLEETTNTILLSEKLQSKLNSLKQSDSLKSAELQKQQALAAINQDIERLQQQINASLTDSLQLTTVSDNNALLVFAPKKQSRLFILEQSRRLAQFEIELLWIKASLTDSDFASLNQQPSVQEVSRAETEMKGLAERLKTSQQEIFDSQSQLEKQASLWQRWVSKRLVSPSENQLYQKKLKKLSSHLTQLVRFNYALTQQVNQKKANFFADARHLVAKRQSGLLFGLESGWQLTHYLQALPLAFWHYLVSLYQLFIDNFNWLTSLQQGLLVGLVLLLFMAWVGGLRYLMTQNLSEQSERLSGNLVIIGLILLRRNWGSVCLLVSLISVAYAVGIASPSYRILLSLFVVWFVFRMMGGIARISLLDRVSDVSGRDVTLYHKLRFSFILGGFITACTVLSQQLALNEFVQAVCNRLFMLFLLWVGVVLLRARDVVPSLLYPYLKPKRPYFKRLIRLFCVLVPLILLSNALVGLLGYVNLTWVMSYYQVCVLLSITAYIIARGLLTDLAEVSSELTIKRLRNGWIWSEALLKPVDRLLRLVLLLALGFAIFVIFGWNNDPDVQAKIHQALNASIFQFSSVNITVKSFIEFSILLAVFIWLIKWTRELSYRFLFGQVTDSGIRNSLAAFTQYTVVILGTLAMLRVLGVDFSGLSFVLGGLAVGMGFGLRDFASNIIGGIMLLIERPVRVGDLISIDTFEGRVTHIGIRAITVKSWDHLEVLIPNAETFNKPFTNWTHQDSVVRTVVPIKVDRRDSPVKIQQLLFDVIAIIPEVLAEPAPQVFLKHIDSALIEFEVRYFINIEQYSRVQVRSIVLFAITAQFKAAGIKAPIPPMQIEPFNLSHDDNSTRN